MSWESEHPSLEKRTRLYWKLSSAFNGRSAKKYTVEKAIKLSNAVIWKTDPQKKLSYCVRMLQDEIILGRSLNEVKEKSSIAVLNISNAAEEQK